MLHRRLDDLLRQRIRHDVALDELRHALDELQRFRADHGIAGVIDERVGRLNDDEWPMAALLASEGRNVTHIPPKKSGERTPDMAVDARFVEIKTSTGGSAWRLRQRLADAQSHRVIVNVRNSRIPEPELQEMVQDLVDQAVLSYARIVGNDFAVEIGRWT